MNMGCSNYEKEIQGFKRWASQKELANKHKCATFRLGFTPTKTAALFCSCFKEKNSVMAGVADEGGVGAVVVGEEAVEGIAGVVLVVAP
jgi:hypothetical protein